MKIDDAWVKVTGKEEVIVGDLSELTDGQAVEVAATPMPVRFLTGAGAGTVRIGRLCLPPGFCGACDLVKLCRQEAPHLRPGMRHLPAVTAVVPLRNGHRRPFSYFSWGANNRQDGKARYEY